LFDVEFSTPQSFPPSWRELWILETLSPAGNSVFDSPSCFPSLYFVFILVSFNLNGHQTAHHHFVRVGSLVSCPPLFVPRFFRRLFWSLRNLFRRRPFRKLTTSLLFPHRVTSFRAFAKVLPGVVGDGNLFFPFRNKHRLSLVSYAHYVFRPVSLHPVLFEIFCLWLKFLVYLVVPCPFSFPRDVLQSPSCGTPPPLFVVCVSSFPLGRRSVVTARFRFFPFFVFFSHTSCAAGFVTRAHNPFPFCLNFSTPFFFS